MLLALTPLQWVQLFLAAAVLGFSKSGVPGTGILAVPLMASVFGARLSIGTSIVLLVLADCFAVKFYWRETRWDHLRRLLPWVIIGLILGAILLYLVPKSQRDPLNPLIGWVVLSMLVLSLLKGKLGEKLVPTSPAGIQFTGAAAGLTTMVSNAAGPIMQIFLVATKMSKVELLGTTSIYFLCVNLAKTPFYFALSSLRPDAPMWTIQSCLTAICAAPAVVVGTWFGRKTQSKVPDALFKQIVLVLAGVASIKMILGL